MMTLMARLCTLCALTAMIQMALGENDAKGSMRMIGGLLMLLVFFAVGCCLLYTRRYFRPILEDLVHVTAAGGERRKPVFEELLPISEKFRSHEEAVTVLKVER